MNILVIRFSSIGDIVQTTPVIRCLKQQMPHASIHYLTKAAYEPILEENPYIDKIITLKDDWGTMLQELGATKYDVIIDLHHNLRTLRIKRLLGVKSYSFQKLNVSKWLLTSFKINRMPLDVHIVYRHMATVENLGVVNDGLGLDYFIPVKDLILLEKHIPASFLNGYMALVVGAALNTKKMPLHKLVELCNHIPYPIVLLGGKEDMLEGNAIAATAPARIYNACGKYNLNQSADIVRQSTVVITHDTGLMHIAAAFKKKIVSIWGNTVPVFGMTPYYGNSFIENHVFEVPNLKCRPCSKIGYQKCPKKHFKCMEEQSTVAIAQVAIAMFENGGINILKK